MNPSVIHRTHQKARRINIRINQKNEIIVTRPGYITQRTAQQYLEKSKSWIEKQFKIINSTSSLYGIKAKKIMLLGDTYTLIVIKVETQKQEQVKNRPFVLELHTTSDRAIHQSAQLKIWMKDIAQPYFIPIIHHWATRTGWQPQKIRVTTMTSRWGSCSHSGNINLNSLLYQAPPEVIEYVIIHELAHLSHPNHSNNFWQAVSQHCPNYQTQRKWLKQRNRQLLGW